MSETYILVLFGLTLLLIPALAVSANLNSSTLTSSNDVSDASVTLTAVATALKLLAVGFKLFSNLKGNENQLGNQLAIGIRQINAQLNTVNVKLDEILGSFNSMTFKSKLNDYRVVTASVRRNFDNLMLHPDNPVFKIAFRRICRDRSQGLTDFKLWIYQTVYLDDDLYNGIIKNKQPSGLENSLVAFTLSYIEASLLSGVCLAYEHEELDNQEHVHSALDILYKTDQEHLEDVTRKLQGGVKQVEDVYEAAAKADLLTKLGNLDFGPTNPPHHIQSYYENYLKQKWGDIKWIVSISYNGFYQRIKLQEYTVFYPIWYASKHGDDWYGLTLSIWPESRTLDNPFYHFGYDDNLWGGCKHFYCFIRVVPKAGVYSSWHWTNEGTWMDRRPCKKPSDCNGVWVAIGDKFGPR